MYNIYSKFNNIIFINLTKKKIKVQSYLISWKKTQFFFSFFEINGLKKNNISLTQKFWNKKLSVFFISNLNMIESKWYLLKTYDLYYNNYQFMKKRNFYYKKYGYILNNTVRDLYINNYNLKNKNFLNLYIWNYYKIYKFEKFLLKNINFYKDKFSINLLKNKLLLFAKNFWLKKKKIKSNKLNSKLINLSYNNYGFSNFFYRKKKKNIL